MKKQVQQIINKMKETFGEDVWGSEIENIMTDISMQLDDAGDLPEWNPEFCETLFEPKKQWGLEKDYAWLTEFCQKGAAAALQRYVDYITQGNKAEEYKAIIQSLNDCMDLKRDKGCPFERLRRNMQGFSEGQAGQKNTGREVYFIRTLPAIIDYYQGHTNFTDLSKLEMCKVQEGRRILEDFNTTIQTVIRAWVREHDITADWANKNKTIADWVSIEIDGNGVLRTPDKNSDLKKIKFGLKLLGAVNDHSALLATRERVGIACADILKGEIDTWLKQRQEEDIEPFKSSLQSGISDPAVYLDMTHRPPPLLFLPHTGPNNEDPFFYSNPRP